MNALPKGHSLFYTNILRKTPPLLNQPWIFLVKNLLDKNCSYLPASIKIR
jgi:hypothetical protein